MPPAASLSGRQFLNLLPGMYELDVEQPRFKHLTLDQIQVRVDNATRLDVSLELGDLTQNTGRVERRSVAKRIGGHKPSSRRASGAKTCSSMAAMS
jgi:hypothetical protein